MKRFYSLFLVSFLLGSIVGVLGWNLLVASQNPLETDILPVDQEKVKIDTAALLRSQFNSKLDQNKGRIAFDCEEFEHRGHGICDVEKLEEILDALERAKVGEDEIVLWLQLKE